MLHTMLNTVVIPSETRAGADLLSSQNEIHEITTIKVDGK